MTKIKKIIATLTITAFLFSTVTPAVVHAEIYYLALNQKPLISLISSRQK